jgi:hypothetical protein
MARGGLLGLLALPVPILLLLMWALGWLHWARSNRRIPMRKHMNGIFYLVGLIVVAIIVVYALGHW